ncbi:unnamed protein product [Arabidopsis lyrata]|nr:unnamed protein product [Arabidopsis lyrata]
MSRLFRGIVNPLLNKFQYRPIGEASTLELSRWDAEAGPSVPVHVLEVSQTALRRVTDLSVPEIEMGPGEDDGVIALFTDYSEDEEERVETPIHVIDLEEYEMVESEAEPEMTMWEDYGILPDSPV